MDVVKVRAWWAHRQGLDGSLVGRTAAEVLAMAGWARSVGGAGPYLGLFARAGISRADVDSALALLEIQELPSARGCTYVLPAADFALGLEAGQPFASAEMKTATKLGVTEAEIDRLCEEVLSALKDRPLDPEQLKAAAGGAARSLGPEGKTRGLANTMPVALERLQASGAIRRLPANGRLDQQRYLYTLWKPGPLGKLRMSAGEVATELARRFFRWIGPATIAEFQGFAGLGVKAARQAVTPLSLVPLDESSGRLMLPDDLEAYARFRVPQNPDYRLVSSVDGIALLRRNLSLLIDEQDRGREVTSDTGACTIGGVLDLPSHAILDRGRIVGLWEYDMATESVAWMSFVPADKALTETVARTEQYVRSQLGDARSFSLDSPKSRAPRIAALRKV